jgi:hypothetical protein
MKSINQGISIGYSTRVFVEEKHHKYKTKNVGVRLIYIYGKSMV